MKSMEMREKFFKFFADRGHTIVASSSLIPAQDPTLLFTNAGMNQFKDVFLGNEARSYSRAVSIQKCMRAGGKHNDLDNVGFTKRHLTFFEMMGNFSFGDYFKKEAIRYAYDFLTKEVGFDSSKMYATIFQDDDESYAIWKDEVGLPANRISRLGAKDNFWQMGDTGPCGPCTEIYVDRGLQFGCGKKECAPGCDCDRFLEVWNNVFMQFDRQESGELKKLKRTGVDTGMGLERLATIIQNKDSVYETDLFMPIIETIERLTGVEYAKQKGLMKASFHVLADHVRSSSFLIADGCAPSNEGRGYVLRKIIRRAALFQRKLTDKNIFPQVAEEVIRLMSPVYPELQTQHKAIVKVLKSEIEKFDANLTHGQHILQKYMEENKQRKEITGQQTFTLYDTYGFPTELTKLIAQEHGFTVDEKGFEEYMDQQRQQSGKKVKESRVDLPDDVMTEFTGYSDHVTESSIIALIVGDTVVEEIPAQTIGWVVPAKTPFYTEKGGQVSDEGWVVLGHDKVPFTELKRIGNAVAIQIKASIKLSVGQKIRQEVNVPRRLATMKNHTATHLLQSALINIFGKQIKQSGSLVHPDYLRFDFTYHENLTPAQIKEVEDSVNAKVMENIPVVTDETSYKDAVNRGAIAYFGEKYNPESVRLVQVSDYSAELCGGTHVYRTGDIGSFKITEVTALSAGMRRIFAVTGPKAVELFQESYNTLKTLAQDFKVKQHEVVDAVERQKEQVKELSSEINRLQKQLIKSNVHEWVNAVKEVNGVPFAYIAVQDFDNAQLKDIAAALNAKKPGFYFLLSNSADKSNFYVQIDQGLTAKVDMQKLSTWLLEQFGLRGGGKGTTLQGGGPRIEVDLGKHLENWLIKK